MYKMWEIMERANTGPFCEVEDFNVKIFMPKIKELIKKYEIKFDPDSPVPADDDLADRVWQAATELFLEVGVLNVDSHRRILLDDAELREALYHAPGQYLVGAGKEARWWRHRGPEDTRPPFCIFSGDITCDEEIFLPMSMAYLQEPLADSVCAPILEESMGRKINHYIFTLKHGKYFFEIGHIGFEMISSKMFNIQCTQSVTVRQSFS